VKIINGIDKMKTYARIMKKENKLVGLVPTMGYLHEGHLSLIRTARKQCDTLITSIFVNPMQFGAGEDFKKYPRDIKKDEELTKDCFVDALFCPQDEDMYPEDFSTFVDVEKLTDSMEGASRPGHFRGVTTVVMKLLEIIKPDIVYFGQKDAQQAFVIRKMVRDLNMDVTTKVFPTVREEGGLAMSSRNTYLTKPERKDASVLHRSLKLAEDLILSGEKDTKKIIKKMRETISGVPSAKIDYISIRDTKFLKEVSALRGEILIAMAVFIGKTRLIDNIMLDMEKQKGVYVSGKSQ